MRRARHLPPDTRPRWDDPDLKATAFHKIRGWIEVGEEDRRGISQYMLSGGNDEPEWRRDPTYYLRKKR